MSFLTRRFGPPPGADRLVVVMSDIEMGAGDVTDDFPHTEFLAELIASYDQHVDLDVDLVFNGDTFDFLRVDVDGHYPRHITAEIAMTKLDRVAEVHRGFFQAIDAFLRTGRRERRVHFVAGNHDAELVFKVVQDALRARCGGSDRISFPGFELEIGELLIEHGSQGDVMFRMDPGQLFAGERGELLNLPWGTLALLEVAIPLYPALYHLDRVRPRDRLFEALPELKELLLGRSWKYWTRDYLRDWFNKSDPMKKISWAMIKEIVYRFTSVNTDASIQGYYSRALRDDDRRRLYVVGHVHQAGWWSWGDKKLLQTGCFRDEFMLRDGGSVQVPIAKCYAEVFMEGSEVRRSHLLELDGPETPAPSIFEFRPVILDLLGNREERRAAAAAQASHEAREHHKRRR